MLVGGLVVSDDAEVLLVEVLAGHEVVVVVDAWSEAVEVGVVVVEAEGLVDEVVVDVDVVDGVGSHRGGSCSGDGGGAGAGER